MGKLVTVKFTKNFVKGIVMSGISVPTIVNNVDQDRIPDYIDWLYDSSPEKPISDGGRNAYYVTDVRVEE